MQMPDFYIVATDFPKCGFGSAGDITESRDAAYDQYAEAVSDGQPARVFFIEFDVETNAFETAREITDEMLTTFNAICAERGLSMAAE